MITPLTPSHLTGFMDLIEICGFPRRSRAGWHWAFFENPEQELEPAGYALETDGVLQGTIGTHRRVLRNRDRRISLISAHTTVTRLSSPGSGIRLMRHTLNNYKGEGVFTLNNNALSAPVYPRIGVMPWRGEEGKLYLEKGLSWFELGVSKVFNSLSQTGLGNALRSRERLSSRLSPLTDTVQTSGLVMVNPFRRGDSEKLDRFSDAMQAGENFEMTRTGEIWRYRLSDPDFKECQRIYAVEEAGEYTGLLAVSLCKESELSASALEIEDLARLETCSASRDDLLTAAKDIACQVKVARVRWRILPTDFASPENSDWMVRAKPYHFSHAQFRDEAVADHWTPGVGNGDFFFATRRPPKFRRSSTNKTG
ncbi:hypothetical protein [Ponticaulis sp.]|uniref:hypothetical protein n=1 Tax=Ponticaulis sp. TaxID=2020902 RepID=UPI000B7483DA|nr:hypothetical protein [Ponticaulis sp.]MAI90372.1 hypothetical protein [Ponticaulis sp.]OUY00074.1 MAG: hypothetical protein CBB65_08020 [Hyphomonadaceae bacterium TMED5]